ncbi:hypothetical protein LTS08_005106 [Lithohypha guttulata]|nr:hypothetical protein LTS08_005106 [Lithohypha guttulata]
MKTKFVLPAQHQHRHDNLSRIKRALWDLEQESKVSGMSNGEAATYRPVSSTSRVNQASHSHSITSLSIYPFDPTPTTLLSTSYDQSLLLTQITPTDLTPLHKFPLDFATYCHAVSPVPDASGLVAVGTAHPAPRLIDLRSALATHALPGHSGAIYSLAWHPRQAHVLISSSSSGQILCFDIRRASPAFASFDVDDSLGVVDPESTFSRPVLDYNHRAHGDAITAILFNHDGSKLISASQDQRIRVWDVKTGRNDLVHFGPRIRNSRHGEFKPILAPVETSGIKAGQETLFWPNDDGRGEIFMQDLREGSLLRVLKTQGIVQVVPGAGPARRGRGKKSAAAEIQNVNKITSGGRINSLAFRPVRSEEGYGGTVEMYSAHGDGRIYAWKPRLEPGIDEDEVAGEISGDEGEEQGISTPTKRKTEEEVDEERRSKRKRQLIQGLVEGLTKRPVTFS